MYCSVKGSPDPELPSTSARAINMSQVGGLSEDCAAVTAAARRAQDASGRVMPASSSKDKHACTTLQYWRASNACMPST